MLLATKIRAARTRLAQGRTERLAHRQLTEELAAFTTESDRADLDEILDRYPAEQTREIRAILSAQDLGRRRAAALTYTA